MVVALVTALSSVVFPPQVLEPLEWATDTGAGRRLLSFEALQDQGFDHSFLSDVANSAGESEVLDWRWPQELISNHWVA